MKYILFSLAIAGAVMSGAAIAMPPAAAPEEATIHFADHGVIQDFQADGREALYLRGVGSQWYHATLMGPCNDLDFANAIGFDAGALGDFDRFSTLIVRGQRCAVKSVVKSGPPPGRKGKSRS
jgi:hypothetical protein